MMSIYSNLIQIRHTTRENNQSIFNYKTQINSASNLLLSYIALKMPFYQQVQRNSGKTGKHPKKHTVQSVIKIPGNLLGGEFC